ncbi:hypothetical protein L1887_59088 [Cichorium endivia]|nr:hypothetical protein L1887_59088 [Cichorium endivia]
MKSGAFVARQRGAVCSCGSTPRCGVMVQSQSRFVVGFRNLELFEHHVVCPAMQARVIVQCAVLGWAGLGSMRCTVSLLVEVSKSPEGRRQGFNCAVGSAGQSHEPLCCCGAPSCSHLPSLRPHFRTFVVCADLMANFTFHCCPFSSNGTAINEGFEASIKATSFFQGLARCQTATRLARRAHRPGHSHPAADKVDSVVQEALKRKGGMVWRHVLIRRGCEFKYIRISPRNISSSARGSLGPGTRARIMRSAKLEIKPNRRCAAAVRLRSIRSAERARRYICHSLAPWIFIAVHGCHQCQHTPRMLWNWCPTVPWHAHILLLHVLGASRAG